MATDSSDMNAGELAELLAKERQQLAATPANSTERLILELQVHQIELEMQNRELRRAQAEVEQSRSRYADLYDLAPVGYCTFDGEGHVLEANVRAAELFNTTRRDLVGRRLTSAVRIDDGQGFRRHVRACFERRTPAPCELTVTPPGRVAVTVELVSTPLVDAAGAVVGCKTTLHDVSRAKLEERRLTLLADASELLASSLDVGETFSALARLVVPLLADRAAIDVVEDETTCRFSSDGRVSIVERTPDAPESVVMRSGDPFYGRSRMCLPLRVRDATAGVLTLAVDGSRVFADADVKLARSLAARAAMAVDNATLYRRARAAVRAREDVLAMVSHDLKNPLQAIRLNAELRMKGGRDDRAAVSILRAVRAMQRLIDGLLDLARIEAGHLVLSPREHRISSIVSDVLELMAPLAEAKGITLRGPGAPVRHVLRCDGDRLLQVFSNIVGNAVKFSDEGATVSVSVDVVGDEARFVVRDTGRGIAPAELPHIFERYRQGERGAERHGSGLGLYIARGIVDAHHGCIEVKSEPGVGTTFTVRLPGAMPPPRTLTPPRDCAPVLVVDDDREVRDLVAAAVERLGYRAQVAADGAVALKQCLAEKPGLVLADLRMPNLDGWDLCRAIKNDPALAAIPIVLLSAEPDVEKEARALGAEAVAKKPIDFEALGDILSAYCLPQAAGAPTA